jgi:hypothetical protein
LYLAEPFPPGRMPSGGTIEEYARIIRVARRTRAYTQQYTAKGMVAKVQTVAQVHLKGWAVQEREEDVVSGEVEVNEMIHQVRLRKGVLRRIEAEGRTFPRTLGPEFGSAVSQRGMVSFVATVFGFEIEGGQREICAARLSKEAVTEVKFIERILDRLDPVVLSVNVFVVTWF